MSTVLRAARASDAEAIAAIYAPYVSDTAISFEETPPTDDVMRARLVSGLARYPWFVVEGQGGVEAFAYASAHRERAAYRWSADMTVYASQHRLGHGSGRALYQALLEVLTTQGFRRAYAGVTLPNAASERLHVAMGFLEVGTYEGVGFKLGRWHSVRWFERSLGVMLEESPQDPVAFAELVGHRSVADALARAALSLRE